MKFSVKDFFSKYDQICIFLQIFSHLLKNSLMENFISCVVISIFFDIGHFLVIHTLKHRNYDVIATRRLILSWQYATNSRNDCLGSCGNVVLTLAYSLEPLAIVEMWSSKIYRYSLKNLHLNWLGWFHPFILMEDIIFIRIKWIPFPLLDAVRSLWEELFSSELKIVWLQNTFHLWTRIL